jgi:uncharacterized protein with NRDE domain
VCTLVALFGVAPDVPLVVGANRDEAYARAWAPPRVLHERPRVVGGQDLTQGGTWLGVTDGGFFVGVTNQRTYHPPDGTKRSRGQLVMEALCAGSVDAALDLLGRTRSDEYNPFNVLLGDARSLYVAYARGESTGPQIERLPAGIWVLNNDTIGSRDFPKASRARELAEPLAQLPWAELAPELARALGDHRLPPLEDVPEPPAGAALSRDVLQRLQALCVHTPSYGTSSSTILAVDEGRVRDYRFAAGPPCVTRFEAVTDGIARALG